MTVAKKAAIPAADVDVTGKVYNYAGTKSDCMPKKPEHEPLARMPETCWVLSSPEGIKRFDAYMSKPTDTREGAALLKMAREMNDKRAKKIRERLGMPKK